MIRIYPLPPVLLHNPYLDLLYGHMGESDFVCIRRIRPVWKEVLEALFTNGKRVFHLHFFDELCQHRSIVITKLKIALFLLCLRLLKFRGVRLVWTIHNIEPHEVHHPGSAFWLYGYLLNLVDTLIVHSDGAAQEIETRYGVKLEPWIIPHGNYVDVYGPQGESTTARRLLNISQDAFVFMAIGEIRPYKGLDLLIPAFRSITESRAHLVIAGAGHNQTYMSKLRQLANGDSRISIQEGFIPDSRLPEYLAASDIIVLPYTHLLTSAVLLLAMSYSRPVIVPNYPSITDLLVEGETGFFCLPNDVPSLVAAMQRAMQTEGLGELGREALVYAQQRDWDGIAMQTVAVYQNVFPAQR